MKTGNIASLLVCAVLVGWFAPNLSREPIGGQKKSVQQAGESRLAMAKADAWLAGEAVLARQPDGHFYAEAMVEGQPARFLVDTGASFVALTGADAEALGLSWDEAGLRPVARGANGIVHGVPIQISHMEVGGFEARDVQAAIIPEGLDVSLLGQSFLSQIENVRIVGDEMRLGG